MKFTDKNIQLKTYREKIKPDVVTAAEMGWPLSRLGLDKQYLDMATEDYERTLRGEAGVDVAAGGEVMDVLEGLKAAPKTYLEALAKRFNPLIPKEQRMQYAADNVPDIEELLSDIASGTIDDPMQTLTDPGRGKREPIETAISLAPFIGAAFNKGAKAIKGLKVPAGEKEFLLASKKPKQLDLPLNEEKSFEFPEILIEQEETIKKSPFTSGKSKDIDIDGPVMNEDGDIVAQSKSDKIRKPKSSGAVDIDDNKLKSMVDPSEGVSELTDAEWAAMIKDLEKAPDARPAMFASDDAPKPFAQIPLKRVEVPARQPVVVPFSPNAMPDVDDLLSDFLGKNKNPPKSKELPELELDVEDSAFDIERLAREFLEEPAEKITDTGIRSAKSVTELEQADRLKRMRDLDPHMPAEAGFVIEGRAKAPTADELIRSLGTEVGHANTASERALEAVKSGKPADKLRKQGRSLFEERLMEILTPMSKLENELDSLAQKVRISQGQGLAPDADDVKRIEEIKRTLPAYKEAYSKMHKEIGQLDTDYAKAETKAIINEAAKAIDAPSQTSYKKRLNDNSVDLRQMSSENLSKKKKPDIDKEFEDMMNKRLGLPRRR